MQPKFKKRFLLLVFLIPIILVPASAQNFLYEISQSIEQYKHKQVTMVLKLKYYDGLFKIITFYDAKNHDISFDFIELEKEPWFIHQKLNLHPGMDYTVTFIVKGVGNLKEVIADLKYIEPVILQKLP
ncbi:MAG: hypothetical protein ACUVRK_01420 [Spirochaetota bacterium]